MMSNPSILEQPQNTPLTRKLSYHQQQESISPKSSPAPKMDKLDYKPSESDHDNPPLLPLLIPRAPSRKELGVTTTRSETPASPEPVQTKRDKSTKTKSFGKLVKLKRKSNRTKKDFKKQQRTSKSIPHADTSKRVIVSIDSFFVHISNDIKQYDAHDNYLLVTILHKVMKQEKLKPNTFEVCDSQGNILDWNTPLLNLPSPHCYIKFKAL